jgi:cell division protein DivIC
MANAKRKKRRRINYGRLVITAIVIFLLAFSAVSVKNIIALHGEKKELEEENAALKLEKKNLTNELENVHDLEYIEEQARKQLKMVKPGEVLYVPGEGKPEAEEGNKDTKETPSEGGGQNSDSPSDKGEAKAEDGE